MDRSSNVEDYRFVWKIKKFSEIVLKCKHSNNFNVDILDYSSWKLVLYPNGLHGDTNKFLSIFISKLPSNFSIPFRFELTLSILSTDASSHVSKKIAIFTLENSTNHGFDCFMKREELFAKRSVYLPQDTLTIQCYIVLKEDIPVFSIDEENESRPQFESNTKGLSNDLYNLYLEGKFCDIKIKTPGRTFSVHKTVFCARSSIFTAMLERDAEEKKSGMFEITEFDSETVNLMITFLYTDSIANLNQDQTAKLFAAAASYAILPLKQRCSSLLKKYLSDVNICETYTLADMHQDVDLKAAVEEFVFVYSYRIFKSCEWKYFMQSNYRLSAEIMHKLWIKNFDD